jgi:hypothetical protein
VFFFFFFMNGIVVALIEFKHTTTIDMTTDTTKPVMLQ